MDLTGYHQQNLFLLSFRSNSSQRSLLPKAVFSLLFTSWIGAWHRGGAPYVFKYYGIYLLCRFPFNLMKGQENCATD